MPRVLLNFQHYRCWTAHFVAADCKTTIGARTRYYDFPSLDDLRAFVVRCNADPEALLDFEQCIKSWGRGSVFVDLSDEQYAKLNR
jgi:hypothetical protein